VNTGSGRVVLLPALLTSAMPQIRARPFCKQRLQRTIFTATRATASQAPAIRAVRQAFLATPRNGVSTPASGDRGRDADVFTRLG
jgi:hypothetical protein